MAGRRVLDVYDEEFVTNMEIAKNLMALVQNPRGEVKSNQNSSQSYIVSVEQLGNDNAELSARVATLQWQKSQIHPHCRDNAENSRLCTN